MKLWAAFLKDLLKLVTSGGKVSRWTLPLSKKSYFVLYDCPGLWCTDLELKRLTEDLRQIALESQSGKELPLYGTLLGERDDLKERVIAVAYSKKGEPLGFSAQKYLDLKEEHFCLRVLHLGLVFVSPKAQGQNLTYLLAVLPNVLLTLRSGLRSAWVSNVSQVPAVVGLVAKNYTEVYPNVDGTEQTFLHRKLASLIVRDHRKAFGVGEDATWDPKRQVLMNAYTGGSDHLKKTFQESPMHRDPKINALCESELNYSRGDDFVQVGQLCSSSFVSLFKSKKSKQSFWQLSFNLSLFVLIGTIVPVIRWLIPGRAFLAVSEGVAKTTLYRGESDAI